MNEKETSKTGRQPHLSAFLLLSISPIYLYFFSFTAVTVFDCANQNLVESRYKQMIDDAWFLLENDWSIRPLMMDFRRHTLTHPSATFSIVAHEALDHIVTDGEQDDYLQDGVRPLNYQRSRRRLGVSRQFPSSSSCPLARDARWQLISSVVGQK